MSVQHEAQTIKVELTAADIRQLLECLYDDLKEPAKYRETALLFGKLELALQRDSAR